MVFRHTDVKAVAAAFEQWKERGPHPKGLPYRDDYAADHVLFSDRSNESITFVSKAAADTWDPVVGVHDDVWLEVW